MKLGPVIKLEKKKTAKSKKSENKTLFSFFQLTANLQPTGSRIPDKWSLILTFSITITFYLTKT